MGGKTAPTVSVDHHPLNSAGSADGGVFILARTGTPETST